MFHGRTLLLFLPLLAQAYCIPFAKSSRAADATRKLLWPVVLWLARRFSYNSFDPPELYFPWNIALFGVVPCYAVARSLFFALCDPENNYTWTGKTPPSTSLGRAVEVLLSMRGLSWSYGAKAPTPPPLAKDTPTFVKRIMIRLLLSHLGMVIFAFPIVHLCKTQVRLDHVLLSPLGIPTNAVSATSVNMLYAMLFGLVAPCTMESAYCLTALVFCLFHCFFYDLNLAHKFDPTQWPPLFRNPAKSESIRDFWTNQWHCLFLIDFLFLAFKPARRTAGSVGLGKSEAYFLGVVAVFLLSGTGHEIALYSVTHEAGVDPYLQTFGAFAVQPVGLLLEQLWIFTTGRRVGGWLGWAWTIGFISLSFSFMVDVWLERGLVDGVPLYSAYKWQRFFIPVAPLLPQWFCTTGS